MIKLVKLGDIEKFVRAAGIISHYVGDASQPLHVSKHHYGGAFGQSCQKTCSGGVRYQNDRKICR
jgi:hypothetical protein